MGACLPDKHDKANVRQNLLLAVACRASKPVAATGRSTPPVPDEIWSTRISPPGMVTINNKESKDSIKQIKKSLLYKILPRHLGWCGEFHQVENGGGYIGKNPWLQVCLAVVGINQDQRYPVGCVRGMWRTLSV